MFLLTRETSSEWLYCPYSNSVLFRVTEISRKKKNWNFLYNSSLSPNPRLSPESPLTIHDNVGFLWHVLQNSSSLDILPSSKTTCTFLVICVAVLLIPVSVIGHPSCCNRVSETWWSYGGWEVQDQGCWQVWCLVRVYFLVHRWLPLMSKQLKEQSEIFFL
jgi:hypothetical protein